jgi:hypothetical protein
MRTFTVIVASAVTGVVVGAAMAYIEVRPSAGVPSPRTATSDRQGGDADAPRVEVEGGNTYHFGQMQRGTSKSHEFILKNAGAAPLSVRVVSTTCKCTVGNVSSAPVPPGGSVPVKLEWTALTNPGQFRQTASLETNDPLNTRVELLVEGDVTDATGVYPRDFMFDQVTAGESRSAEVYVMALLQDTLEVGKPTLSNPELEKFFDVEVEQVDRSDLPTPKAKDGVRITLTAKPGLPLGHFNQVLELPTNLPDAEKLKIPVVGRVVGNISVHGRHWNEGQGVLRIGHVKSAVGAREDLNLVVRGDSASAATLAITAIDPPELKATLGEPKLLKDTLLHVPLTIDIPKGTPPMARLDTQQSDEARVVLSTGLADVPEMVISVRFAVER